MTLRMLLPLVYVLGAALLILRSGVSVASYVSRIRLCEAHEWHRVRVLTMIGLTVLFWPITFPVVGLALSTKSGNRAAEEDARRALGSIGCCVCGAARRRVDR